MTRRDPGRILVPQGSEKMYMFSTMTSHMRTVLNAKERRHLRDPNA